MVFRRLTDIGFAVVVFLLVSLVSVNAAPLPASTRQETRPLIIIIPGNQETVSGVASTEQADGETLSMRAMRAASKVRDFLNDSHSVEATLYAPDVPLFVRAAQEAKVKLARRYNLTTDEEASLAKAAGAIYTAVIGIQRAADGGDAYEMTLQGVDTESKKIYADRAKYLIRKPTDAGADANAIHVEVTTTPANALNSAANTLVTRLLNGPLAAYGRVAPPPVLNAPKPADPASSDAASETDTVNATLQQASSLLADGNNSGAITLLRRAINQAPLNLKMRMLLARTYLSARQSSNATGEIKRAFTLITPTEDERKEATALLSEAFQQSGNSGAARATYEEIIAAQPGAKWARLALADMLQAQQPDVAEAQYRAVLQEEPGNSEAAKGLAQLLAQRGDFAGALAAVVPPGASPQTRATTAAALFDAFATQAMRSLKQNRSAWEGHQMTREAFYKATVSQVTQTTALVTMIKGAAPPDPTPATKQAYAHRMLAGSLLAQAATAMQTFLETGDKDSGAQSRLWLTECQKELSAIK